MRYSLPCGLHGVSGREIFGAMNTSIRDPPGCPPYPFARSLTPAEASSVTVEACGGKSPQRPWERPSRRPPGTHRRPVKGLGKAG